CMQYTHIPFTF
nr:immunoglobulin light chain junction region [Macaca mulatta]MOX85136.1 immunoglobulin light chain junction region [Macaca mulatta]MOX85449.1 immunoglobulin light chain junction region [Macaca mulatta]MOX85568.1 immunoglobulin light chain junction region [Macaca mulatta]MOX85694.1 immunoglobulin light chain junction region [Macaca mulatta]